MEAGFNSFMEFTFVAIFAVDSEFRQVTKELFMFKILRRRPTKE